MTKTTTKSTTASGLRVAALVLCWMSVSSAWAPATAGIILQDLSSGGLQINYGEPVGQSFTTIDTHINFALWLYPINPHFPNSDPVEFSLYEGAGLGGTLLATRTIFVPTGFRGYFDVDFTSIPLTVGSVYTGTALIDGTSPYWGVENASGDPYDGGDFVALGILRPRGDARFRVTGTTVPIPSTLLLAGLGVAVLVRRRYTP